MRGFVLVKEKPSVPKRWGPRTGVLGPRGLLADVDLVLRRQLVQPVRVGGAETDDVLAAPGFGGECGYFRDPHRDDGGIHAHSELDATAVVLAHGVTPYLVS